MKKLVILALFLIVTGISCLAKDVMPSFVTLSTINTIGVYQVDNVIILRTEPDDNAKIKKIIKWSENQIEPKNLSFSDVFAVLKNSKGLAYLAVTDEDEEWVEVIYNNKTGDRGWLKKDDPYKFFTWYNFYSMYGKKYGLYLLTGAPDSAKQMRGNADDSAKVIATINTPVKINLNLIRGNWMLLTVMDMDRIPKTGYVRWRSEAGEKYLFPAIK